jgi:hypothetical protein
MNQLLLQRYGTGSHYYGFFKSASYGQCSHKIAYGFTRACSGFDYGQAFVCIIIAKGIGYCANHLFLAQPGAEISGF